MSAEPTKKPAPKRKRDMSAYPGRVAEPTIDRRAAARALFEGKPGSTCESVGAEVGVPVGTIRRWKAEDGWKAAVHSLPDLSSRAGLLADSFKVKMSELGKPLDDAVAAKRKFAIQAASARNGIRIVGTVVALLAGLDDAWRVGLEQMQQLLNARVDGLFQRMWLHLGTALLLLGCILSLVYLVASQIARPLQALARVADDVRHTADYTRRAHWHSRDEIGQLFTAFNGMLAQLDHDRLAQQELAASARAAEAQLELVEAFPIPMVVTSVPDHEVLHANAPAQRWLGDCQSDPWRLGLEPGVRARFFQRLADNDAVDEFEVRWLGGHTPSWAVLSARRLNYQGRDAVLTSFAPINKLKVMEQRLELWAKVFEASSESIIIMDESRKIISVNRAFCRSTSYDFYEVVGQDMALLLGHEADGVWAALREIPAGQTASYADIAKAIGRPTAARAARSPSPSRPAAAVRFSRSR